MCTPGSFPWTFASVRTARVWFLTPFFSLGRSFVCGRVFCFPELFGSLGATFFQSAGYYYMRWRSGIIVGLGLCFRAISTGRFDLRVNIIG